LKQFSTAIAGGINVMKSRQHILENGGITTSGE